MAENTSSSVQKNMLVSPGATRPDTGQDERRVILEVMACAQEIINTTDFDLEALISKMLRYLVQLCQAKLIMFYILDRFTDEMVILSIEGEMANPSLKGLRFNKALGILGTAAQGKKPILAGNLVDTQHWLNAIDPNYANLLNNYLTLPLHYKDSFIGAIQIFNYRRAELDLLQILGDTLINEIGKQVSFKHIQKSNHKLKNLIVVLQKIAGNLDRDQLLHLVTEHASQLVNAERSSIFLADSDNSELNFQVSYRNSERSKLKMNKTDEEIILHLFNTNESGLPINGANEHLKEIANGSFGFVTRSAVTVPLQTYSSEDPNKKHATQTIGGLMVLNKLDGDFCGEDNQVLRILADQTSTFLQIADVLENANDLFLGVVKSMVTAIDAKDPYTQGHSLRVSELSVEIATELGLSESQINNVRVGSLLHDIGKIGTPDHILKKKGSLTNSEYDEIKIHTVVGHNIMRQSMALQPVLPAILSHHERLDGSGYPYGLKGNEIPLMSRIVAVADVYDAMASERPYRPGKPIDSIVNYLMSSAGKLLDQDCVQALSKLIDLGVHHQIYQNH